MAKRQSDRKNNPTTSQGQNRGAGGLDPAKHPQPDATRGQEGDVPPSHEASLMNFRTVVIAGIGVVLMILFVLGLAALPRLFIPAGVGPSDFQFSPQQPTLQVNFLQDMAHIRATEDARLNGYGYVDRGSGVIQIPIEAAMEKVAGGERAPAGGGTPDDGSASEDRPPEASGAALFQELGCNACHQAQDSAAAPSLVGIFGQEEALEGGETVLVDEAYLQTSIVDPHSQLVQGYGPIMPNFGATLSEDQVNSLVAYIQTLQAP